MSIMVQGVAAVIFFIGCPIGGVFDILRPFEEEFDNR
jgi:hypothetical protein